VLLVRAGPHAVLLTGDIERDAEAELLAAAGCRAWMCCWCRTTAVAHRRPRRSSPPRAALGAGALGHRNRWGFPKPDVVARWQASGAQVLVGSATGAIEFELAPPQSLASPRLWRPYRQRLWHDP